MGGGFLGELTMSSALQVNPDIGLEELLQVSNSNQWSIQYSPFLKGPGGQVGGTIIRQAAPWKGMSEDQLEENYPDVYDGLQEAQDMARSAAEDGVALVNQDGRLSIMSQTAANLAEEGSGNAEVVVRGLPSYDAAVDELVSRGGQAALPTVA